MLEGNLAYPRRVGKVAVSGRGGRIFRRPCFTVRGGAGRRIRQPLRWNIEENIRVSLGWQRPIFLKVISHEIAWAVASITEDDPDGTE